MCYRAIGLVLVLVGCAGVAGAISAPLTDPSYIPHDDFVSWNWRDLAQNPGIPLLATPSGQTNLIRM